MPSDPLPHPDRPAQGQSPHPRGGEFRIYLSSTLDDMVAERAAALDILRRHGRVIDSYRAGPEPTVDNCLSDVRQSQLYVVILGKRYGWVPAGEDDPVARSITELEYDACVADAATPVPRLVFLRTTNPDRFTDDDTHPQTAARMREFRARAGREQQAYTFDTLPQLTVAMTEAVMRARRSWEGAGRAAAPERRASLCIAPWELGQTLRPLPGHPVLGGAADPVLTGGALVNVVLSHDHASSHGIVVTSLVPEWSYTPPGEHDQVRYEVDGAALTPQGFFTPERFTLVLAGPKLRSASWSAGARLPEGKAADTDLLSTDPPRQIQLGAAADDTMSLQGVVRLTEPGRYTLRWRVGFTVSGAPGVSTTAPVRLAQAD